MNRFTHRDPEGPTEADGLLRLLLCLRTLSVEGTVVGFVDAGRVLQERLRLTALQITLRHKHTT